MTQPGDLPELERLDAGPGPARPLSATEAEAQAQRVLRQLRRKSRAQPLLGWLVAASALLALGAWASRAALLREPPRHEARQTPPSASPEPAARQEPARAEPAPVEARPGAREQDDNAPGSAREQDDNARAEPARPRPRVEARGSAREQAKERDWLKLANAERVQRNYAGAFRLYLRAAEAHPDSDDAYAALLAAAELEREHLKNPRAALRRYETVLRVRPRGALSEQARVGRARAYAALADATSEAAAWRELLSLQPGSWFEAEARARLEALSRRR